MSEQQLDIKEELDALGVNIVDKEELNGSIFLGIQVDLDTEVDYSSLVEQGLVLKKTTKRTDFFYITLEKYDKELRRLTFSIATPISDIVGNYYKNANIALVNTKIGTSFTDLCWYHAEGTNELSVNETETKFREEATMGDLNWYLPSRMMDNFIEIMHTLNQSLLQGLMQETICYGPYLF